MFEKKINLNFEKSEKSLFFNSMSKIYKAKRTKNSICNCLCCKKCNIYWRPWSAQTESRRANPQKTIKFKKEFYCNKECLNCKKYILKKEEQ